jgi:dipeptidyl aminopeptidase/acylaminoacyl peptidase
MNLWKAPVDRDGRARSRVESAMTPSRYSSHISFSRNGQNALYVARDETVQLRRATLPVSGKGASLTPASITRGLRSFYNPAVDPAGRLLAFHALGDREDLFLSRTDGSDFRQLTDDPWRDRLPQWSRDGQWIAFYSNRQGDPYQVWAIRPDGSGLRQITFQSGGASYPVWSPDGARLLYNLPVGSALNSTVGVMRPDVPWASQTPQTIHFATGDLHFIPYDWSPSQEIAGYFTDPAGQEAGIAVLLLRTGQIRRISEKGGGPRWLPGTNQIVFVRNGELWSVNSESRVESRILQVPPDQVSMWSVAIESSGRSVYFGLRRIEADIWLISRE